MAPLAERGVDAAVGEKTRLVRGSEGRTSPSDRFPEPCRRRWRWAAIDGFVPATAGKCARLPPCDHASVPCGAPSARRSFRVRRGAAGSSELHPLVSRQGRATPCARGRTRARTTPLTWDIHGLSHVAHRCLKRISALPSRHGPMAAEDFGNFRIRDDMSPCRI